MATSDIVTTSIPSQAFVGTSQQQQTVTFTNGRQIKLHADGSTTIDGWAPGITPEVDILQAKVEMLTAQLGLLTARVETLERGRRKRTATSSGMQEYD